MNTHSFLIRLGALSAALLPASGLARSLPKTCELVASLMCDGIQPTWLDLFLNSLRATVG